MLIKRQSAAADVGLSTRCANLQSIESVAEETKALASQGGRTPRLDRHHLAARPTTRSVGGVTMVGTESAARVEAILGAAEGRRLIEASAGDRSLLARIHDPEFLDYLEHAAENWLAGPYVDMVGQDRVVPYFFPTPALIQGMPPRRPAAAHALAGEYCYDTIALVGPGTWQAAAGAIGCALTVSDLVIGGEAAAYALCRPPGHHATRGVGGSCYLNNAAAAAVRLRDAGHERVGILDLDAHHGNGTQAISGTTRAIYGSVHVDPGAGWFPHIFGYADERGGLRARVQPQRPAGRGGG